MTWLDEQPDARCTALSEDMHAEHPRHITVGAAPVTAGRFIVAELIERLRLFPPHLQVWVADPGSVEGYVPLDGSVHRGSDPAPSAADPAAFVLLGTAR